MKDSLRSDQGLFKYVRAVSAKDIQAIGNTFHLRPTDSEEAVAMLGIAPNEGLRRAFWFSDRVLSLHTPEEGLVAFCGVFGNGHVGAPWMVASEGLKFHNRTFIRYSKKGLSFLARGYRYLCNYVGKSNTESIRWLSWLGFQFDDPNEYFFVDPQYPFLRFYKEF